MYEINLENGNYAIMGGIFLGGGGGGSYLEGLATLENSLKLGEIIVKDIEDFNDEDIIVTASAVGSPASEEGFISVEQVINNFKLFKNVYNGKIAGIITNENGGHSTANGWILSAATGIPLVDAPCNGRAHPTGVMGSMGLEIVENYVTVQTASGGKDLKRIETYSRGSMERTSRIIRHAAVEAGGLVTVLRNPVKAEYVGKNAAPKAIMQAVEIGKIFVNSQNTDEIITKLINTVSLEVVAVGRVTDYKLITEGGFDHGYINISADNGKKYEAAFWNEFMTVDSHGRRLATFPDLIGCIDAKSGKVLTSAEISKNDYIYLYKVPKENLILGSGMKNRKQFQLIENILRKDIVKYTFKEI